MFAETSVVSAEVGTPATQVCRRCRAAYLAAAGDRSAACPSCGAGLHARGLKSNGNAAFLCLLTLPILIAGMVLPFIEMSQLGERRVFSLLTGIRELADRGNLTLAAVLFTFSVAFPIAKLVALLVATTRTLPLTATFRTRLHRIAALTARYSMLDIFVVAITIILIKFDNVATVTARPGTLLFCGAVLLSIVAGYLVDPRKWEPQ